MLRWSESRQLPRNFLVTSWRLPRNICYGEVTGKLVPVEFELDKVSYLGEAETLRYGPIHGCRSVNWIGLGQSDALTRHVIMTVRNVSIHCGPEKNVSVYIGL